MTNREKLRKICKLLDRIDEDKSNYEYLLFVPMPCLTIDQIDYSYDPNTGRFDNVDSKNIDPLMPTLINPEELTDKQVDDIINEYMNNTIPEYIYDVNHELNKQKKFFSDVLGLIFE